jgi:hypothetical protein
VTAAHQETSQDAHWTRQLYREFDDIVWYFKVKLKPPVIEVRDLGGKWGQWDPLFRTISINNKLILEYSWDVVLEVFKHEIAHQYVCDIFGAASDNTHGNLFQKACDHLGVPMWATKSGGELPERIPSLRERGVDGEGEKLIAKTEKLLALAESGNEHEALLAMNKVRELYAKYDLERLIARKTSHLDSLIISRKRKKLPAHETAIFSILNDHFCVRVVHMNLYCAVNHEKYKAVELLGTRQNLLMAEYVFYFLLQKCEVLWANHRKKTKSSSHMKRSYLLGVLHGFSQKLASEQINQKTVSELNLSLSDSKALVTLKEHELTTYVARRFPRISSVTRARSRVDGSTFSQGKSDGHKLTIYKGVGQSGGFGGFLR